MYGLGCVNLGIELGHLYQYKIEGEYVHLSVNFSSVCSCMFYCMV